MSTSTIASNSRSASALAAALLAAVIVTGAEIESVAASEKKLKPVVYKKDSGVGLGMFGGKLLHSYGYKDKQLQNGNWEITGQAKAADSRHSKYIALYRAAEIATELEKPFIRIVMVNGKTLGAVMAGSTGSSTFSGPAINYGTRYVVEVEFVNEADGEAHCSDDVLAAGCQTIEVASAVEQIRPYLKIKARK